MNQCQKIFKGLSILKKIGTKIKIPSSTPATILLQASNHDIKIYNMIQNLRRTHNVIVRDGNDYLQKIK